MQSEKILLAHFDGDKVVIDSPHNLKPDMKLSIIVLADDERNDLLDSSLSGLNLAYGNDEPDYSLSLIKEPNLEYNSERT